MSLTIKEVKFVAIPLGVQDPIVTTVSLLSFPVESVSLEKVTILGERFLLLLGDKENDESRPSGCDDSTRDRVVAFVTPEFGQSWALVLCSLDQSMEGDGH
jgi:hypothetical protein